MLGVPRLMEFFGDKKSAASMEKAGRQCNDTCRYNPGWEAHWTRICGYADPLSRQVVEADRVARRRESPWSCAKWRLRESLAEVNGGRVQLVGEVRHWVALYKGRGGHIPVSLASGSRMPFARRAVRPGGRRCRVGRRIPASPRPLHCYWAATASALWDRL